MHDNDLAALDASLSEALNLVRQPVLRLAILPGKHKLHLRLDLPVGAKAAFRRNLHCRTVNRPHIHTD